MNTKSLKFAFKTVCLSFIILTQISTNLSAQETEFKRTSIKTGIGLGFNIQDDDAGIGPFYTIGWQNSYGKKNRLRINPNLNIGRYTEIELLESLNGFFVVSSLGFNLHYDLIKYKIVSLVTTGGVFFNYSRGQLAKGWTDKHRYSPVYSSSFYPTANLAIGVRLNPENRRLAYEYRPITLHYGNTYIELQYCTFELDFKLKK